MAGAAMCRGTQGPCGAVLDVSRCGTAYGADLGCSSSYSIGRLSGLFEDWSVEQASVPTAVEHG